ncbi:OLC1v1022953C5 [Oldenlandia corymbosa var. corymbosa]|uniref:OLC1v1022953C5 n=1 Tax=Oldenlandia corymbosa var. corymbosa TaxID=529605 RepID=A0AAV1BZP1_OLDCO|nr:OLC1v1022953C5 [Oldenlandia corymbosa var. corymbosa]
MTAFLQVSNTFSALNLPLQANDLLRKHSFWGLKLTEPLKCYTAPQANYWLRSRASGEKATFLKVCKHNKGGIFIGDAGRKRIQRVVLVRFDKGFGFNGLGDGGGGKDDGTNTRVVVNLILAIGLTYLTMTGQLGWVIDTIVSVWLLAVLLPIVGVGAFLWWAGRDMVQGSCPNCGNAFQVFKSTLNDDLQLCPFCSQPFSVVGDEFVSDPVKFSNQSPTLEEAFSDFFSGSKRGKDSSKAVVDVEAEVKDAE